MDRNIQKTVKKIAKRSLTYIQKGYTFGGLPLVFFGYMSSIYYLAITNIAFLKAIFPSFYIFLFTVSPLLVILCGIMGYGYYKKLWFYRQDITVCVESDPIQAHAQAVGIQEILRILKALNLKPSDEYLAMYEYWRQLDMKHKWKP